MADELVGRTFKFLRNGAAAPEAMDWSKAETARQAISEAMNAKNIAFLLGAGCSSLMRGGTEVGISTMAPLAREFCSETLAAQVAGYYVKEEAKDESFDQVDADVDDQADDGFAEEEEDLVGLGRCLRRSPSPSRKKKAPRRPSPRHGG